MIRICTSIVALGAVLAGTVAPVAAQDAAAETHVFTRTGQWQLEAADEECRLARMFTRGDEQIALALERSRADPIVRLVLVGNGLRPYRGAEELGFRLAPVGEAQSSRYIESEMSDGQAYYNLGNVRIGASPPPPAPSAPPAEPGPPPPYDRAAELEYAAGITAIEITSGVVHPVRLETGSLRAAMQALQACTDDLLLTWGLDWEKHQTMTRRAAPQGNVWDWLTDNAVTFRDFPAFLGGRNSFRIMVSATGAPTGCVAQWPSLSPDRNAGICERIMANGRFTPALDAAGEPMASYWMADFAFYAPGR